MKAPRRGVRQTRRWSDEIKLYHGENGRYPSYDELVAMMKTHGVTFTELPPFQAYGYDAASGKIGILEDREEKARRYQAAGIPVE